MDYFEQIRKRQEEKLKIQELKVQNLQQKLQNADQDFFNDQSLDLEGIKRKDLLIFQSKELKTVFTEDDVPEIMVTPPSPPVPSDEKKAKVDNERESFVRGLMVKNKPLLQRQKSNPTTMDMTKEESIAKYIRDNQ